MSQHSQPGQSFCLSRRQFLLAAGAATAAMSLGGVFGRPALAEEHPVVVASYPKKKIGTISGLQADQPVEFRYPFEDDYSRSLLVKLGTRAGGGVGPQEDIVAFSTLCTHTGGNLARSYKGTYKLMGPCPLHLTTFDLTRHGIVAAGQATAALPQILLQAEGDELYAVGVLGLLFGTPQNLMKFPARKAQAEVKQIG